MARQTSFGASMFLLDRGSSTSVDREPLIGTVGVPRVLRAASTSTARPGFQPWKANPGTHDGISMQQLELFIVNLHTRDLGGSRSSALAVTVRVRSPPQSNATSFQYRPAYRITSEPCLQSKVRLPRHKSLRWYIAPFAFAERAQQSVIRLSS